MSWYSQSRFQGQSAPGPVGIIEEGLSLKTFLISHGKSVRLIFFHFSTKYNISVYFL